MDCTCQLVLEFKTPERAEKIFRSLRPDDDSYLTQELQNDTIHVNVKAKNPGSLREAVDDYLSCVSAAEDLLDGINLLPP